MKKVILILACICLCATLQAQNKKKEAGSQVKTHSTARSYVKATRKRLTLRPLSLAPHNHYVATLNKANTNALIKPLRVITSTGRTQTKEICNFYTLSAFEIRQRKQITFDKEDLSHMAIRDVNDALSLVAGVYQKKRGEPLHVDGGRGDGNLYVVDGMYILKN